MEVSLCISEKLIPHLHNNATAGRQRMYQNINKKYLIAASGVDFCTKSVCLLASLQVFHERE